VFVLTIRLHELVVGDNDEMFSNLSDCVLKKFSVEIDLILGVIDDSSSNDEVIGKTLENLE
jgi:hypothetical protein